MNKTLQKKLLSYSALATALLAVEKPADAQIVYKTLTPADTFTNQNNNSVSYYLDLNNDSINDFVFVLSSFVTSSYNGGSEGGIQRSIYIKALDSNKVAADTAENYKDSICNNKWIGHEYLIQSFFAWENYTSSQKTWSGFWGVFADDTNKYIPLRLKVDSNYYYGWARITIGSTTQMMLLSGYGYDTIPNECTTAGDTTEVLTSIPLSTVYENTMVWAGNNYIYIKFSNSDFLNGTIELYNIEGQKLIQQTISNSSEILNTQQYVKGIYLVAITKNGVRKVYKVALL